MRICVALFVVSLFACGPALAPSPAAPKSEELLPSHSQAQLPALEIELAPPGETWRFPDPEWAVEPAQDHGFDSTALEELAARVGDANSKCLVITRHGVVVGEWYWNGWTRHSEQGVFSVSKTVTSAVVGLAVGDGALSVDDPASWYVGDWVGSDSESVTVRNLLSNDSGRHWDFYTDYVRMAVTASDKTAFAVSLGQQHDPGVHWEYNNSAIQTLEQVLETATGEDLGDYARRRLFEPLGMATSYGRDATGNAMTYSDVSASCRDLARLGYLYLRGGRWHDEQVLTEEWIAASTTPSTQLNSAYGYLWWLNHDGHWVEPSAPLRKEGDGQLEPGLPASLYFARGFQGQSIGVDPELEVVFTRIGGDARGETNAGDLAGIIATAIRDARVE